MSITAFTSLDFTGTADAIDVAAAKMIVDTENVRRAAILPTPLPPLPFGTNAEKKSSYLTAWLQVVTQAHVSYRNQFTKIDYPTRKAAYEAATQSVRDQIDALLGL